MSKSAITATEHAARNKLVSQHLAAVSLSQLVSRPCHMPKNVFGGIAFPNWSQSTLGVLQEHLCRLDLFPLHLKSTFVTNLQVTGLQRLFFSLFRSVGVMMVHPFLL